MTWTIVLAKATFWVIVISCIGFWIWFLVRNLISFFLTTPKSGEEE